MRRPHWLVGFTVGTQECRQVLCHSRIGLKRQANLLKTRLSAAGWAISLLQPTLIAFLLAPFWIPAAIGIVKDRPVLALAASAAGVVYAATVFHFGIKNAGATLLAREPEIFKMLDPKAA